MITYRWRDAFTNAEVNGLHADGFGHPVFAADWWARLARHSLGWVCARRDGELVGFANVAWDGATHAFLLDVVTAPAVRGQGIGREVVAVAARQARAAGCAWLHVDFEEHLRAFYFEACGFRPTDAGLVPL